VNWNRRTSSTSEPTSARRVVVFGQTLIAACLAFYLDLPISRSMVQGQALASAPAAGPDSEGGVSRAAIPQRALRSIHRLLQLIEDFGRPPAVIAVSLAILLCAGSRRGVAFRIAAVGLIPGIAVDVLKLCVARTRPRNFDFQGNVFDTFQGLFPGTKGGYPLQSWPSGHSAVAVGFALALAAVFPRGRWLFVALAGLVMLQRIESCAHFPSDTLFSAAVAYAIFMVIFGRGPIGRWFERLESRWAVEPAEGIRQED